LRCRIPYVTDDVIVGSQAFVELHFSNLNNSSLRGFVATGAERSHP